MSGHTPGVKRITLGLVLVASLVLAVAAASATSATRPTVRLVDRTPIVVRGSGFEAHERVTVVVAAGTRWTRRVTATAGGTLVARFTVSIGRCARYSIQAFGSAGSRARVLPTRPVLDCAPSDD